MSKIVQRLKVANLNSKYESLSVEKQRMLLEERLKSPMSLNGTTRRILSDRGVYDMVAANPIIDDSGNELSLEVTYFGDQAEIVGKILPYKSINIHYQAMQDDYGRPKDWCIAGFTLIDTYLDSVISGRNNESLYEYVGNTWNEEKYLDIRISKNTSMDVLNTAFGFGEKKILLNPITNKHYAFLGNRTSATFLNENGERFTKLTDIGFYEIVPGVKTGHVVTKLDLATVIAGIQDSYSIPKEERLQLVVAVGEKFPCDMSLVSEC